MKRRIHAPATLMILALAGGACRPPTTVVRTVENPSARSWVGESLQSVVKVWGPAGSGESDGLGGRIYTYGSESSYTVAVGDQRHAPQRPEGAPVNLGDASPTQGTVSREVKRSDAKFWVSAEGRVYRYWFSPQVWKSTPEKAVPPSGAEAKAD